MFSAWKFMRFSICLSLVLHKSLYQDCSVLEVVSKLVHIAEKGVNLKKTQLINPWKHSNSSSVCLLQVMQERVCLNWAKSFRKILLWGIELDKIKRRSWKREQEGFFARCTVYIKLLQNRTSLGKTISFKQLWRDAGDRDGDSWVDLNQVWAVWEKFGFWLICFLFLSYSARALIWHR